ncbi:MAG: c-type cytochrome [Gammaproteobacteria bacterium]
MQNLIPKAAVRHFSTLGVAVALCFLAPVSLADETALIENGKDRFMRQCGICHGVDGAGAGAFAELLVVAPPDLTVLAQNNDGHFPFKKVHQIIDGRELPLGHGTGTMPIWGDRYEHSVANSDETIIAGRIFELMLFLESIQKK